MDYSYVVKSPFCSSSYTSFVGFTDIMGASSGSFLSVTGFLSVGLLSCFTSLVVGGMI